MCYLGQINQALENLLLSFFLDDNSFQTFLLFIAMVFSKQTFIKGSRQILKILIACEENMIMLIRILSQFPVLSDEW